jgi:hypothetical protein
VLAAQTGPAHVDYHTADLIRASTAFVLNSAVNPTFFQDSTRFYYRAALPSGVATYYVVGSGQAYQELPRTT